MRSIRLAKNAEAGQRSLPEESLEKCTTAKWSNLHVTYVGRGFLTKALRRAACARQRRSLSCHLGFEPRKGTSTTTARKRKKKKKQKGHRWQGTETFSTHACTTDTHEPRAVNLLIPTLPLLHPPLHSVVTRFHLFLCTQFRTCFRLRKDNRVGVQPGSLFRGARQIPIRWTSRPPHNEAKSPCCCHQSSQYPPSRRDSPGTFISLRALHQYTIRTPLQSDVIQPGLEAPS